MTQPLIQRGGESYYSISAARDAISALRSRGVAIVGVEGFRLTATSTEPLMDYIAHWPNVSRRPWEVFVARCAGYCLQVLAEWNHDLPEGFMVSLALDEDGHNDSDPST